MTEQTKSNDKANDKANDKLKHKFTDTWLYRSGACLVLLIVTIGLSLFALKSGSLSVSWVQLGRGLFVAYDETVAIIYDMRLPRILVALMAGAGLAASGLLFQSVLRNPLADPGIMGISGGAKLVSVIISVFFPSLFFFGPIFAFGGGFLAYLLVYRLAWRGSLEPVRLILVGVAIAAVFEGLIQVFGSMANTTGVALSISGLTQLVWSDVRLLGIYSVIGLSFAWILAPMSNLMALEDQTVRGLGIDVDRMRLLISGVGVFLAAGVTSVVGVVGFLALVAPHIGRKIVGNDHRILMPFTMLLGSSLFLLADTLGRLAFSPGEVSAYILLNILGGPFFIFLLHWEGKRNGN